MHIIQRIKNLFGQRPIPYRQRQVRSTRGYYWPYSTFTITEHHGRIRYWTTR